MKDEGKADQRWARWRRTYKHSKYTISYLHAFTGKLREIMVLMIDVKVRSVF